MFTVRLRLEEEDDLVTRWFGLGRLAGGLVGPSWCGPILFYSIS
jgi:hypothetical protein